MGFRAISFKFPAPYCEQAPVLKSRKFRGREPGKELSNQALEQRLSTQREFKKVSDTNMAAVLSRLEQAEARLAIMDLEAEYARAWDAGDAAGWAAVFTEDGVFDLAAVGAGPRLVHKGRQELVAFCTQVDAFYKGLHFMHLPRLQIEGDTAQGRVHFQWQGLFNTSAQYFGQRTVVGYYDVSYQRVHGRWLMKHRLEKAVSGQTTEHYDVYQQAALSSLSAAQPA